MEELIKQTVAELLRRVETDMPETGSLHCLCDPEKWAKLDAEGTLSMTYHAHALRETARLVQCRCTRRAVPNS